MVSLTVGIYEDIHTIEYDSFGNKIPGVKWVEGVAIIIAVVLVVVVGSVNDFQKEKQFRSLNAKKDDRNVSVSIAVAGWNHCTDQTFMGRPFDLANLCCCLSMMSRSVTF